MQTTTTETQTALLAEIAAALQNPALSAKDLVALSERAAKAEATASLFASDARGLALNPSLHPDRVAAALEQANAQAFHAERLAMAREALDAQVGPRFDAEIETSRLARRTNAIAGRDRVAARAAEEYPIIQAQLTDLLAALMQSGDEVDAANRDRAEGEQKLQRAEGMARGFDASQDMDDLSGGGAPYNSEIFRLTQIVLPDFGHPDRLAWPPCLTIDQTERIRRGLPHLDVVRAGFAARSKESADKD